MNEQKPDRMTREDLLAIEAVTRKAGEARERFVRELDGLLYDLQRYTEERRKIDPPADDRRVEP